MLRQLQKKRNEHSENATRDRTNRDGFRTKNDSNDRQNDDLFFDENNDKRDDSGGTYYIRRVVQRREKKGDIVYVNYISNLPIGWIRKVGLDEPDAHLIMREKQGGKELCLSKADFQDSR